MPSDDLLLNVRQIANYTLTPSPLDSDQILLQRGGLGGPYFGINPPALVSSALANGANLAVGGSLFVSGNGTIEGELGVSTIVAGQAAVTDTMSVHGMVVDSIDITTAGSLGGSPIATAQDLANTVTSLNGRTGDVVLTLFDVPGAAPLWSPRFQGAPTAPTPDPCSCSERIATTAFVQGTVAQYVNGLVSVFSFNGRTGDVVLTDADINAAGGLAANNAALTGIPTAPTPAPGTNTAQIATAAFVNAAVAAAGTIYAPINSPVFTGVPSGPTAPTGSTTGQLATTAFVANAVEAATAGVSTFNTRTGNVVLGSADLSAAGGALLASPTFTGTPAGPTAAPGTSSTQLATTAYVLAALGVTVSSFNGRSGVVTLTLADITGIGGAPLASPSFTGAPQAPTPHAGNSSENIATTLFVAQAIAAAVVSFNGRTGAVTLNSADVSAAGGAVLASPAFTGAPTAPTATVGTNTTQLATTAYVMAALVAGGGVASFNGRAGAVTLTLADVTTAFPASAAAPLVNGTAGAGALNAWSRGDHVHPTDTSRYSASNPSNFQTGAQLTTALASYLPLSGGALSGGLTVGGSLLISGAVVNLQPPASTNAAFNLLTSAGTTAGQFVFQAANGFISLIGAGCSITLADDVQMNPEAGHNFLLNSGTGFQTGGGSWSTLSDERIKTVDHDYTQGLDAVLALRPVVYRFKGNDALRKGERSPQAAAATSGRALVGLVAQEAETVMPEMVAKRAGFIDGGAVSDLRTLDVSPLVYALVNAVKTLAARVAALEAT